MRFFSGGNIIIDYRLKSDGLKLECISNEFVFYKHAAIHFTRC